MTRWENSVSSWKRALLCGLFLVRGTYSHQALGATACAGGSPGGSPRALSLCRVGVGVGGGGGGRCLQEGRGSSGKWRDGPQGCDFHWLSSLESSSGGSFCFGVRSQW